MSHAPLFQDAHMRSIIFYCFHKSSKINLNIIPGPDIVQDTPIINTTEIEEERNVKRE